MILPFPEQRPWFAVPPGYGMHRLTLPELKDLPTLDGQLQIYQHPRRGHKYIMGIDVGDGLGQDYSVCDVFRMGTIEECEEQVAQFRSNTIPPSAFAYIVDAIGHLYTWPDGREALASVECNNHGLSVQDTLQLHLGYRHFYIWEVLDQADPNKRFTTRMGWVTNGRTRPILLDKFYSGVTSIDPLSGYSDCRINSKFTLDEMRDFQTDGALWEAAAARGAHDDCVLAAAIAHYVAHRLAAGETEPLADRRRRRAAEALRRAQSGDTVRYDYRNSDTTADQMSVQGLDGQIEDDDERSGSNDDLPSGWYDGDGRASDRNSRLW